MNRYSGVLIVAISVASVTPMLAQSGPSPRRASFSVKNVVTIKVPPDAKKIRMWLAVPQADAQTTVTNLKIEGGPPVRYTEDSWGNRVAYMEGTAPTSGPIVLEETFDATRTEIRTTPDAGATRPLNTAERTDMKRYLQPTTNVVVNDEIRQLAASIVGQETNPVRAARKLYDWTYQNINYWVKDPDNLKASPVGSSVYCLTTKTGNCTDFHSLFSSLAMAAGIPNRMVYGSLFKPTLNGMQVDASYHCWIEFFAPQLAWIPLDASLANIYWGDTPITEKNGRLIELTTSTGYRGADRAMIDYYFGNVDERRVVWSVGRDLMMEPAQQAGPVNALHKIYVEIDGKESTDWTRVLTYRER
jgi:transglutaminase-like putative cysteine protease